MKNRFYVEGIRADGTREDVEIVTSDAAAVSIYKDRTQTAVTKVLVDVGGNKLTAYAHQLKAVH